jgi:hypothetical protein
MGQGVEGRAISRHPTTLPPLACAAAERVNTHHQSPHMNCRPGLGVRVGLAQDLASDGSDVSLAAGVLVGAMPRRVRTLEILRSVVEEQPRTPPFGGLTFCGPTRTVVLTSTGTLSPRRALATPRGITRQALRKCKLLRVMGGENGLSAIGYQLSALARPCRTRLNFLNFRGTSRPTRRLPIPSTNTNPASRAGHVREGEGVWVREAVGLGRTRRLLAPIYVASWKSDSTPPSGAASGSLVP